MPKSLLTQAQKEAYANEKRRERIADGLAAYKNRHKLSDEALGLGLGLGRSTIAKILNGEEVTLKTDKHFKVLALSGYQMRRMQDEQMDD